MDPQIAKLLELTEENNQMLRAMRRSQRWASIMRAFYWLFIIGATVGAFYFLQPYIEQLKSIYGGADAALKTFQNFNQ